MQEISFRNDILPLKDKLFRLTLRITFDRAEAPYDDYPVYYMMGELVLPVDDSVTLSDSSASVDAVPVETNGAIEVGKAVSEDKDDWTPYNTTVFTKDGVVSNILRIWVP